MKELRSARAWRYSSLTEPGREAVRAGGRGASDCSAAPRLWRAAKTSFEISVCTAIKSSEGTLIEPPERTLCELTSSNCQFRSKPDSERRKLPARTYET